MRKNNGQYNFWKITSQALILILIIISSVWLYGLFRNEQMQEDITKNKTAEKNETEEVIKYQCYNGDIKEKLSECEEPEPVIKYQCQDGSIEDNKSKCEPIENVNNSPTIFISNFEEDYVLPYIVTDVVHGGEYKIQIYEKLYDESGDNIWNETSDIGIYSGECSHRNPCVPKENMKDYLRFGINFNPSEYPSGTYDLEIKIVDEITGKSSTVEQEINF